EERPAADALGGIEGFRLAGQVRVGERGAVQDLVDIEAFAVPRLADAIRLDGVADAFGSGDGLAGVVVRGFLIAPFLCQLDERGRDIRDERLDPRGLRLLQGGGQDVCRTGRVAR